MKKNNYERPSTTLVTIYGKDDLLEKGNIHFSSKVDHGGGRADDAKEQWGDLWEDEEFEPQKFENEW